MRDEIEREIKRRDRQDGPEREAAHDSGAARGGSLPIERQPFAADARGLFGRYGESENRAVHFGARGADGLARFQRDQARKFFAAFADAFGNGAQDGLLFIPWHLPCDLKCALCGADGCFGVGGAGAIRCADYCVVVGSQYFKALAFGEPFSVEIESPGLYWCFCCGSHDWSSTLSRCKLRHRCDSCKIGTSAASQTAKSSKVVIPRA